MGKILIPQGHGATQFYRLGWGRALSIAGYEVMTWHNGFPAFDIFNRTHPTIVFCGTWELDDALLKCLRKWNCQVILWGSTYGDFCKDIDSEDPVQVPSEQELRNVEKLLEFAEVKNIYSYYHHRHVSYTHGHWLRDFQLKPRGIPLAADIFDYGIGDYDKHLACNVSFIGGHWPYKAKYLEEYLYPLSRENGVSLKIFGTGNWQVPQYLGTLETQHVKNLFASSTVSLNLFEPLSIKYGIDVNERGYKILSSGGICLSQRVKSAVEDIFTDGEVIFFDTYDEILGKISELSELDNRVEQITRGIKTAYDKHTYLHRAKDLLLLEDVPQDYIDKLDAGISKIQSQVSVRTGVQF